MNIKATLLAAALLAAAPVATLADGPKETALARTAVPSITREVYEAFQRGELQHFDAVIAPDVLINSPGGSA